MAMYQDEKPKFNYPTEIANIQHLSADWVVLRRYNDIETAMLEMTAAVKPGGMVEVPAHLSQGGYSGGFVITLLFMAFALGALTASILL